MRERIRLTRMNFNKTQGDQKAVKIPATIALTSTQVECGEASLFEKMMSEYETVDFGDFTSGEFGIPPEKNTFEMVANGFLTLTDERVEVEYNETELTGMDGSTTTISFARNDPGVVTMLRCGTVSTALVFEEEKRHLCAYDTGVLPFELCIYTKSVKNGITEAGGRLELQYLVEIRGAKAEQTKCVVEIRPVSDATATADI